MQTQHEDTIQGLQATIQELQAAATEQQAKIDDKDAQIVEMESTMAELRSQIRELETTQGNLTDHLAVCCTHAVAAMPHDQFGIMQAGHINWD